MKTTLTILLFLTLGGLYAQTARTIIDPYDSITLNQLNRQYKLVNACFYVKTALNDSVKFDAFLNATTIPRLNYLAGSDSIVRWLKLTYPHTSNYNATWGAALINILK